MTGRPLVNVGDVVNAEEGDYHRGDGPTLRPGAGDLHLRVTHVPMDAATWEGDWVALRGVEKPPGEPEQPEAAYVIRRRALPGYRPRRLPAVPGLAEWRGE